MAAKERLYLCNILSPVRVLLILLDSLVHVKYQNIVSLFFWLFWFISNIKILYLFFSAYLHLKTPSVQMGHLMF